MSPPFKGFTPIQEIEGASMAKIEINGAELDYMDEGRGDSIVLVHGSMSDRRSWEQQCAALRQSHRVIAYSRRYHWPNDPIPSGADYSMLEHVDDLLALIDALEAVPAHLVGLSYGGYVSLLAAMRWPDAVRSLVLAEPPVLPLFASNPPKPQEMLRLLVTRPRVAASLIKFGATGIGPAEAAFRRGDIDGAIAKFLPAVLGPETVDQISPERMEQVRANTIPAEFLGSGFAPLSDADVKSVHTPTLLLNGEKSPGMLRHFVLRLEQLLPNAERKTIPNASHNMNETAPEAFNAAVAAFVERH